MLVAGRRSVSPRNVSLHCTINSGNWYDFLRLRERRVKPSLGTSGGAGPKELLSAVSGLDSRCKSSPTVLPARSSAGAPRPHAEVTEKSKTVHRGSGCTPRTAGNRGELTTRTTVSPHVGRRGAHQTSLGMSGTAAGWKRGRGPSAFFQRTPSSSGALSNPPFRLHLMRDPVSRPLARPRRALSRSETLQDRESGVRGGWVWCASGRHRRRLMMADEHG